MNIYSRTQVSHRITGEVGTIFSHGHTPAGNQNVEVLTTQGRLTWWLVADVL